MESIWIGFILKVHQPQPPLLHRQQLGHVTPHKERPVFVHVCTHCAIVHIFLGATSGFSVSKPVKFFDVPVVVNKHQQLWVKWHKSGCGSQADRLPAEGKARMGGLHILECLVGPQATKGRYRPIDCHRPSCLLL